MPEPITRTVLVPTLIETLEQAEALPVGVEVRDPDTEIPPCIWRKTDDGDFRGPDGLDYTPAELLAGGPLEALVPVEATVETDREWVSEPEGVGPYGTLSTRLTTPWTPEETP